MRQQDLRQSAVDLDHAIMATTLDWATMRSKDPSTCVGACIYDTVTGAMHLGYNGFPRMIYDEIRYWEAKVPEYVPNKYDLVVHAEKNAMIKALQAGADNSHTALYCTHAPCAQCWRDVIASLGIPKVVVLNPAYPSRTTRDDQIQEFFIKNLQIAYKVISL